MDIDIDAQIHALRAQRQSLRQIGLAVGLSHQAVFFRLGGQRAPLRNGPPVAANDNKTVKMMPHNGGCSSVSGEMPVSLRRTPTLETAEVPLSDRELQMMQVAA